MVLWGLFWGRETCHGRYMYICLSVHQLICLSTCIRLSLYVYTCISRCHVLDGFIRITYKLLITEVK